MFALYLALYAVGRVWIEGLRIDDANSSLGLRLNDWVMGVVLLGALAYLWLRRSAGREERRASRARGPRRRRRSAA